MSEAKADELIKKADKAVAPGLFRLKPHWEKAIPLYEEAANHYRTCKAYRKAKLAFEKAAEGQERVGTSYSAAKLVEQAAQMAQKEGASAADVAGFYRQCRTLYVEAGRSTVGAEALARGAKALESLDADTAVRLYLDAIETLEEEGADVHAAEHFRAAISFLARTGRYNDLVPMMLRFAVSCEQCKATSSMRKAYLGAVVVALYMEDLTLATQTYGDVSVVPGFSDSSECRAAERLILAYEEADVDAIKTTVQMHEFTALDVAIARLARKLPRDEVKLQELAQLANDGGPPLDEDDLT